MLRFWFKTKNLFQAKPLLFTWVIVGLVLLVVIFSYYGFFQPSLVNIGHRVTSLHLETAKSTQNQIIGLIDKNIGSLGQLADILSLPLSPEQTKTIVNGFFRDHKWFDNLSVADGRGREILKISQTEFFYPRDYGLIAQTDYFLRAAAGEPYYGPVFLADSGAPTMRLAVPIRGLASDRGAVLAADFSLWKINELLTADAGQNKRYVTDSLGYVIAHSDPIYPLRKYSVASRRVVAEVVKNKQIAFGLDAGDEYVNEQGEQVYAVGVPMAREGWGVFTEEPAAAAWAAYKKIRLTGVILGFSTFALLLVLLINARSLNLFFNDLRHKRKMLADEVDMRTSELSELDKTTKLLVRRDLELSITNHELDKKIEQLEKSEKSLLRAFGDIRTTQLKLEEEKEKTVAIINNFIDPIIVLNERGEIVLFNPSGRRVFGLENSHYGLKVSAENNFSFNNFRPFVKCDFKAKPLESLNEGNISLEEVEVVSGEHTTTYKAITGQVLGDEGENLGILKIFYDISREKDLDRLKSEFISIAAHQLRTPLSAIKWVIKMVLDEDVGPLNKEQSELLEKGYKSNERIIHLVNDLLNVSRIEEGRFGYNFEKHDFLELVNSVVEGVAGLIDKNKIKLVINKPNLLPPIVFDQEKMLLVMQNLVDNALKYTPERGRIEINIDVDKEFFKVSVTDNGVGIPEKDKQKLFSKFFRAANVIRMQTEGSGLGLFIVKNIINKHGGVIFVDSQEGRGTEVHFTLPLKKI